MSLFSSQEFPILTGARITCEFSQIWAFRTPAEAHVQKVGWLAGKAVEKIHPEIDCQRQGADAVESKRHDG